MNISFDCPLYFSRHHIKFLLFPLQQMVVFFILGACILVLFHTLGLAHPHRPLLTSLLVCSFQRPLSIFSPISPRQEAHRL